MERLADADAFAPINLSRREATWQARALQAPKALPLFGADGEGILEPETPLPTMTLGQEVIQDYLALRLSLRAHPLELLRPELGECLPHEGLRHANGRVSVSGLVITRERPGTASGVVFLTLEDETGVSNVVVWRKVYEAFRKAVIAGRLLRVTGRIEREGQVTHLIAEKIEDLSALLSTLGQPAEAISAQRTQGRTPAIQPTVRHAREQAKKLFPSSDFH